MVLRAVLDTNVLVSALLWKGTPHEIFLKAMDGEFQAVASQEIIEELRAVLEHGEFGLEKEEVQGLLKIVTGIVELMSIQKKTDVSLKDAGDRNIIDCAVNGKADFIVTGDRELLELGKFQKIKIVSPKEFIERLK